MITPSNLDQNIETKKVRELLAKNIDSFKYLVLCNLHLEDNNRQANDYQRLDTNRISGFQDENTESLEEWVSKQKIKSRDARSSVTLLDMIEQWLMNEAKKDLFAEMDVTYGNARGISSEQVRELGSNLISLADKLDRMKSRI